MTTSMTSTNAIVVKGLYRHAVKGLSADSLDTVTIQALETFPDDRRFALLLESSNEQGTEKKGKDETTTASFFDPENPEWLHKSNFLCAFTDPTLMAQYRAHYTLIHSISDNNKNEHPISLGLPNDKIIRTEDKDTAGTATSDDASIGGPNRLLSLYERKSDTKVLDSIDLSLPEGRQALANFFSSVSSSFTSQNTKKKKLTCVTAENFQFGNTSSGVKNKGNTRTVHIINAATVRDLSKKFGIPLNPTRFRPNIVIDDLPPWEEFQWIGKTIQFQKTQHNDNGAAATTTTTTTDNSTTAHLCQMDVIQRTVRCDGVSIDPLVFPENVLDIPALLVKHFPEHGPYLGVYAHVEQGGTIHLGDSVSVL